MKNISDTEAYTVYDFVFSKAARTLSNFIGVLGPVVDVGGAKRRDSSYGGAQSAMIRRVRSAIDVSDRHSPFDPCSHPVAIAATVEPWLTGNVARIGRKWHGSAS